MCTPCVRPQETRPSLHVADFSPRHLLRTVGHARRRNDVRCILSTHTGATPRLCSRALPHVDRDTQRERESSQNILCRDLWCVKIQNGGGLRTEHAARASTSLSFSGKSYRDYPLIDYCPHCYNARGPKYVKQRSIDKIDPAILDEYGGGVDFPLYFGEFAENGNYLETDEIAKRHGICGDPEQVRWPTSC